MQNLFLAHIKTQWQYDAMKNVSEFLKSLGKPEKVAQVTGVTPNMINVWISRGSIPRRVWPELMQAYPRKASLKALLETEQQSTSSS